MITWEAQKRLISPLYCISHSASGVFNYGKTYICVCVRVYVLFVCLLGLVLEGLGVSSVTGPVAGSGSPWPGCCTWLPLCKLRALVFFEEGAVFSAEPRRWRCSAARATWRGEAASPLLLSRSFLPRVQWALCGPTPSLFSAVYLLNVGYYSRRERKRERENNNLQELVIPVFHLPRPAARRGAAFAVGMCCYNSPASYFLWM